MEHNTENPKCSECGSISQKFGLVPTRKGKKQRFRCIECGKTFYESEV